MSHMTRPELVLLIQEVLHKKKQRKKMPAMSITLVILASILCLAVMTALTQNAHFFRL